MTYQQSGLPVPTQTICHHAKKITLGDIDMRAELAEQARRADGYWE